MLPLLLFSLVNALRMLEGESITTPSGTIITKLVSAKFRSGNVFNRLALPTFGAQCAKYAIIASRGTGEDQRDPNGSRALVATVTQRVPGGEAYEVQYPAGMDFIGDPAKGVVDLVSHLSVTQLTCPNRKLVLFGYSQGALVAINALTSPEIAFAVPSIRALIFYGNPYFRAGLPQDRGDAKTGRGIGLIKNVIPLSNSEIPLPLVPITRDFCHEGDPVCQGPGLNNFQTLITQDVPKHHYEGTAEEVEAINFVLQQLQQLD